MGATGVVGAWEFDRVDRAELLDSDRHRLKALGPGEADGGSALSPHRIGEHARAVDLEQHGRVAEPGGAEARVGAPRPGLERALAGQRRERHPALTAEEEVPHHGERGAFAQPRPDSRGVAEDPTVVARARQHALASETSGSSSWVEHGPS